MSTSSSAIARAIAELETERQNLTARIGKLDDAIATLRALFHLPAERALPKTATAAASGNGHSTATMDAIRAALERGPLSPSELSTKVKSTVSRLRYHVQKLEAEGAVVTTGISADRRIALAAHRPKEAPQR